MSKKSQKKGRIPKTIAGVKLPKDTRKHAEWAIEELNKPIVREMIAGAIGMAANAMAKQAAASASKALPIPQASKAGAAKPIEGKSSGDQFAEIATGLAMAGLGKLFEKMSNTASAAATKPGKKG